MTLFHLTIDMVPTSQLLRHDKVVGDMQIVSISCWSVSQYIILRGGLGYRTASTRGSPYTQQIKTSIYRRQETYHILYNEFVMDREEDSIRYQYQMMLHITHIFHMCVPYCLLRHHIRPITIIQKSIVQYKRLSSLQYIV